MASGRLKGVSSGGIEFRNIGVSMPSLVLGMALMAAEVLTPVMLRRKQQYQSLSEPDLAALVAFLASDEAAFMCGSLVEITGAQAVA